MPARRKKTLVKLVLQLDPELIALLEHAAAACDQNLSEFAESALGDTAERVLRARNSTVLSATDWEAFLAILDRDEEPNEALKRAAHSYKKLVAPRQADGSASSR